MTFKNDIIRQIESDFGEKSQDVFDILKIAVYKTEYLKTDRIIRCIIYLSKGEIPNLIKFIEAATFDTRDVMLWAEYENMGQDKRPIRVRDFNKTFEESSNDVKE